MRLPNLAMQYCIAGMICCSATAPGAERVFVGDAAFILVVVPVHFLHLIDDGTHRFPVGAGESAHDDVHLILQAEPLGELLVHARVRLRIGRNQLDLASKDSLVVRLDENVDQFCIGAVVAGATWSSRTTQQREAVIDLLDRQLRGMKLRQAEQCEVARLILEQPKLDFARRRGFHVNSRESDGGRGANCRCASKKLPPRTGD